MRIWVLAAALAVGCSGDDDTDGDKNGDGSGWSDLDDPSDGLEARSECETAPSSTGEEVPVSGATSYWVGMFGIDGEEVVGQEVNVLLANAKWKENSGGDCRVVVDLWGTVGEPVACATCDYSITFDASLNSGETDCPGGYAQDYESYSDTYDIRVGSDGSSQVYWTSGTLLGEGTADDDGLTYTSDYSCKWF